MCTTGVRCLLWCQLNFSINKPCIAHSAVSNELIHSTNRRGHEANNDAELSGRYSLLCEALKATLCVSAEKKTPVCLCVESMSLLQDKIYPTTFQSS